MKHEVSENGMIIAQFVRLDDAKEFVANLEYEDGYKDYVLRPVA